MRYIIYLVTGGVPNPICQTDQVLDAYATARFFADRGRTVQLLDTANPERGPLFTA